MRVETVEPPRAAPVALAEFRSFLRIEGRVDEAELAAHLRTATQACEGFLGYPLLTRTLCETLSPKHSWQRLSIAPVVAITGIDRRMGDGGESTLDPQSYGVDIDGAGRGWIRAGLSGGGQLRVTYTAGSAGDWNDVPEPVRHGILRLASHLRIDGDGRPPAAVIALWRPWRSLRLGAA